MKRVLVMILILFLTISICGCSGGTTVESESRGVVFIERYYTFDGGDLFLLKETNTETGVVVNTYFYWKYDDRGCCTLDYIKCTTVDSEGNIISPDGNPGHS